MVHAFHVNNTNFKSLTTPVPQGSWRQAQHSTLGYMLSHLWFPFITNKSFTSYERFPSRGTIEWVCRLIFLMPRLEAGPTSNALESRYHCLSLLFVSNGEMDYTPLTCCNRRVFKPQQRERKKKKKVDNFPSCSICYARTHLNKFSRTPKPCFVGKQITIFLTLAFFILNSRLPIIPNFKGNRKKFKLSGVRVIERKII